MRSGGLQKPRTYHFPVALPTGRAVKSEKALAPAEGGAIFPPMGRYDMEEGTYYLCQRCTACCRWPGEVPVTGAEVARIAAFLGMDEDAFIQRYADVNLHRTGLTLVSKPDHQCIFLDGADCTIQPVKPAHCAGFPNQWNFPGWRKLCEAVPVPLEKAPGA